MVLIGCVSAGHLRAANYFYTATLQSLAVHENKEPNDKWMRIKENATGPQFSEKCHAKLTIYTKTFLGKF